MNTGRTAIIPAVDGEESEGRIKLGKEGGDGDGDNLSGEGTTTGDDTGAQSFKERAATVGPGSTRLRDRAESAASLVRWNGLSELAWKRRHANDPAMMRELKRYQNLMLLTILPAISGEGEDNNSKGSLHPEAHPSFYQEDNPSSDEESSTRQEGKSKETDDNHNEHLPKPIPKDAIVAPRDKVSSMQTKHTGNQTRSEKGSHPSSGSSGEGPRLPLTVYNPLNKSPKRRGRRKSQELRRRKSYGGIAIKDERKEVAEVGSSGVADSGGSPMSTSSGPVNDATNGAELDLLTLAALYLESRHRVFGKEWHYRTDSQGNARPVGQVANTGISRPRRLTPLSPNPKSPPAGDEPTSERLEHRKSFSGVIPAPAGLHLSVNYTQNLDLDEASYFAERARALKPRLRRLNSLDDITTGGSFNEGEQSLYRATSAPDLSQSGHTKNLHSMLRINDSQDSLDSISPMLVTPARANTPTGAKHSAALIRPQIVGGSLATNSAIERTPPLSSSKLSLSSSRGANYQGKREEKTRALSEGSGRILLQPPPWSHMAPELKALDVPSTPPPSALVDTHRKNGRVHLEPLTIRKAST